MSAPAAAQTDATQPRLVLIDGSGYIFRAFFALPPLTDPEGMPVGAVFGFCNMLFKLSQDMAGEQLVVVFDKGSHSFRNEMYDQYKANRQETPEDLVPQFPLVRDAAHAFGLPVVELEGYEADDIIATYARQAEAKGRDVVIVSSDKDLMQLIGGPIAMYDPMKAKTIDRDEVIKRFGVGPELVRDVLALAGDSSDNVPGVPGIGVKTAAELLNTHRRSGRVARSCAHDQAAETPAESDRACRAGAPLAAAGHLVRDRAGAGGGRRAGRRPNRLRPAAGVRAALWFQVADPTARAVGGRAGPGDRTRGGGARNRLSDGRRPRRARCAGWLAPRRKAS